MSFQLLRFDRPDDPPPPIPVDFAVARGQRTVNRPVKFLIIGGLVLALIGFQRSYWFLLAAPVGWIMGWCWWSYAAPRWRTWAIARGTNARALQWFAEKGTLLWPKGHWGERTEFGSRAVRESQQPVEPFQGDPIGSPAYHNWEPGFRGPPSTRSFLVGVAFWTIGMPIGRLVLNGFTDRPASVSVALFSGLFAGVFFAAIVYGKASWRSAVSPEHAFGLGLGGACLLVAMSLGGPAPPGLLQIVLGMLLLIAPMYLMVMAVIEWRRRAAPE